MVGVGLRTEVVVEVVMEVAEPSYLHQVLPRVRRQILSRGRHQLVDVVHHRVLLLPWLGLSVAPRPPLPIVAHAQPHSLLQRGRMMTCRIYYIPRRVVWLYRMGLPCWIALHRQLLRWDLVVRMLLLLALLPLVLVVVQLLLLLLLCPVPLVMVVPRGPIVHAPRPPLPLHMSRILHSFRIDPSADHPHIMHHLPHPS